MLDILDADEAKKMEVLQQALGQLRHAGRR